MSRIGKLPVALPEKVEAKLDGLLVKIKGAKGELEKRFRGEIKISQKDNAIIVEKLSDTSSSRAMWGTARSIINNMVKGVSEGFEQVLEIKGVGYRAAVQGKYLNLILGKSHATKIEIPEYIEVVAGNQGEITLKSIDKEKLGQFTAIIVAQRPPEPYKGKGIRRKGQYIERKEGKKK